MEDGFMFTRTDSTSVRIF